MNMLKRDGPMKPQAIEMSMSEEDCTRFADALLPENAAQRVEAMRTMLPPGYKIVRAEEVK